MVSVGCGVIYRQTEKRHIQLRAQRWSKNKLKTVALYFAGKLSKKAARNFNDDIGELSQQYKRGDLERAARILELIGKINKYFEEIRLELIKELECKLLIHINLLSFFLSA
jgi:hypothetical protein